MRPFVLTSIIAFCVLCPSASAQERLTPVRPADPPLAAGIEKPAAPHLAPASAIRSGSSGRVEHPQAVGKPSPAVRLSAAAESAREGRIVGAQPRPGLTRSAVSARLRQGDVSPDESARRALHRPVESR